MNSMYVRDKLHEITYDDAVLLAKDNGVRRAENIIQSVADSLKLFREIAKRYAVQDRWINSVESAINGHLVSWGLVGCNKELVSFGIDGKWCSDVRIEQTYKGNYHLYATVDGHERKLSSERTSRSMD